MSRTSHQTKPQKRNLLGVSSRLRRASPLTLITQSTFVSSFEGFITDFKKGPSVRSVSHFPLITLFVRNLAARAFCHPCSMWYSGVPYPHVHPAPSHRHRSWAGTYMYVFSVADVRYPSRLVAVPQLLLACNVCVRNLINISVRY